MKLKYLLMGFQFKKSRKYRVPFRRYYSQVKLLKVTTLAGLNKSIKISFVFDPTMCKKEPLDNTKIVKINLQRTWFPNQFT